MAYEEIMTKPTLSSAISKTTSSISVTETNATMVMVAKISGKTVKDGTTLKSAAVESVVSSSSLVDIDKFETGTYDTNGVKTDNNDLKRTPNKIAFNKPLYCSFSLSGTVQPRIYWYNSSGTFLSTVLLANNSTVSIPSGATQFTIALAKSGIGSNSYVNISYINAPYYKTTVLVPSSIKNLPDYGCSVGDIVNEIDFENGVYYHRVGSVDMGTLPWGYNNNASHETMRARVTGIKKQVGGNAANIITGKFETRQNADPWNHSVNNSIGVLDTDEVIVIYSSTMGTDATAFKNSLVGQKLNYELGTVETIPLSDYLRPLPVEVGGTITLVNPYNLDVNSTIKYKKEVN